MAIEARSRSPQEGEQRPLGYLVLNGELLRGPFIYSLTEGNEVLVNGRRVYPRVSRFPSDPTDDFEIEDIRVKTAQSIVLSEEDVGIEYGKDLQSSMRVAGDLQIDLVQRRRAIQALESVKGSLENGVSRFIMESEGWELSFTDDEAEMPNKVKTILGVSIADLEKARYINRLFNAPSHVDVGSAVVANAGSWR